MRRIRVMPVFAMAVMICSVPQTSVAALYYGTFTGEVTSGGGALFGYGVPTNLSGVTLTGSFTIDTAYAARDPSGNLIDYSGWTHEGLYRGPYGFNYSEQLLQITLCGNGVCYSISDTGLVDNNGIDAEQIYIFNPPSGSYEQFSLYDLDYDECWSGCQSLQNNYVSLTFSELLDNIISSDGLSQSFSWVDNDGPDHGEGAFRIADNFQNPQGLTSQGEGYFRLNSLCYNNNCGPSPVPLPAAAWLLLSGLGGLGFMGRRRKAA